MYLLDLTASSFILFLNDVTRYQFISKNFLSQSILFGIMYLYSQLGKSFMCLRRGNSFFRYS